MVKIIKEDYERTIECRPWGNFMILSDEADHKVKRITVHPAQRLSLQRHRKRWEHWLIVSGRATVTLEQDTRILSPGEAVDIGMGVMHRVQNNGLDDLVFIEVQLGEYFGEDDIERFEDDYGRIE